MLIVGALFFTCLPGSSYGQEFAEYKKLLIPTYVRQPVPGAFGSLWSTVLTGYFDGEATPRVQPLYFRPCPAIGCETSMLARRMVELIPLTSLNRTSAFLFVHEGDLPGLWLQLRAQDLSRQSQTWGTELPIVSEDDAFAEPLQLLNVPFMRDFRQTLRVYSFDWTEAQVEVRVYGSGEAVFDSTVLTLLPPAGTIPGVTRGDEGPAQAEISWLASAFPVVPQQTVRIEVRPLTEGLRFWAYVSVTNNETQHITTITPQLN